VKQGSLLYSFSTCPSPNHLNLCRTFQAQPNIRPTSMLSLISTALIHFQRNPNRWSDSCGGQSLRGQHHQIIKSFSTDVKGSRLRASPRTCKLLCRKHSMHVCMYVVWCVRSAPSSMCMWGFSCSHLLPHVSKHFPLSLPTFSSFNAAFIFQLLFMLSTEIYKLIKIK